MTYRLGVRVKVRGQTQVPILDDPDTNPGLDSCLPPRLFPPLSQVDSRIGVYGINKAPWRRFM